MSITEMDHVFTTALREVLAATVEDTPRVRRRWRWRVGTGVFVGVTLVAGGVALASGVFNTPGAPVNTPLGNVVTATRTGTATIDLGTPPATSTDLSLSLTCLTVGTFYFPNGSSESCDTADMSQLPLYRTASEVVPLAPGVDSVTITTSANHSWTLQATYVNQVTTAWGVNAKGETYGVQNQSGTPDLIAVVIDQGTVHGYVEESELSCAAGGGVNSPTEALKWDKESQNRNISIPVYESNGTTVIGTFITGDAAGPEAVTVPLSSLDLGC
jgi:hypothetical protein